MTIHSSGRTEPTLTSALPYLVSHRSSRAEFNAQTPCCEEAMMWKNRRTPAHMEEVLTHTQGTKALHSDLTLNSCLVITMKHWTFSRYFNPKGFTEGCGGASGVLFTLPLPSPLLTRLQCRGRQYALLKIIIFLRHRSGAIPKRSECPGLTTRLHDYKASDAVLHNHVIGRLGNSGSYLLQQPDRM